MIVSVLIISGGLLILVVLVVLIARTGAQYLVVVHKGTNDDEAAISRFIKLVKATKKEMLIHDDGDRSSSLYQDHRVLSAVEERLEAGATIRCLFNEDSRLGITELATKHDTLVIRYSLGTGWRSALHFKLVDGGKIAYLTKHREDGTREYRLVDCTMAPRTGRRMFRPLADRFEEGFGIGIAKLPRASRAMEIASRC